jgi:hypothetical protein
MIESRGFGAMFGVEQPVIVGLHAETCADEQEPRNRHILELALREGGARGQSEDPTATA